MNLASLKEQIAAVLILVLAAFTFGLYVANSNLKAQLAETRSEFSQYKAQAAEQQAQLVAKHRQVEVELSTRNERLIHELAEKDRQLAARAAAARRSDAGLRDEIARLNARPVPANPELAAAADEARAARELLGSCSQRYTELAREADELRDQVTGLQDFATNVCRAGTSVSGDLTPEPVGQ